MTSAALALVELVRPRKQDGSPLRGGLALVLALVLVLTIGSVYLNTPPLWFP